MPLLGAFTKYCKTSSNIKTLTWRSLSLAPGSTRNHILMMMQWTTSLTLLTNTCLAVCIFIIINYFNVTLQSFSPHVSIVMEQQEISQYFLCWKRLLRLLRIALRHFVDTCNQQRSGWHWICIFSFLYFHCPLPHCFRNLFRYWCRLQNSVLSINSLICVSPISLIVTQTTKITIIFLWFKGVSQNCVCGLD